MRSFPRVVQWKFTIGRISCPGACRFWSRVFRGQGQGGVEPAVRLAVEINGVRLEFVRYTPAPRQHAYRNRKLVDGASDE